MAWASLPRFCLALTLIPSLVPFVGAHLVEYLVTKPILKTASLESGIEMFRVNWVGFSKVEIMSLFLNDQIFSIHLLQCTCGHGMHMSHVMPYFANFLELLEDRPSIT